MQQLKVDFQMKLLRRQVVVMLSLCLHLLKMLVNLTFLQRKDIKIFSKLRVLENSKSFEDIYSKLVKIQSSEIDIFKDGFKKFENFYLACFFRKKYLFKK